MLLTSINYNTLNKNCYPFNLPLFSKFNSLKLHKPVTILVGENGTGKSTLLEAIAYQAQMITIGSLPIDKNPAFHNVKEFARRFNLVWTNKTKKGFFLRAEDFLGYVKQLSIMKKEAEESLASIEIEYKNRSQYAKNLAKMPHYHTLNDLNNLYSKGLEYRSHGERYLDFFQSRFKPGGLYILDEPEVPLSPMKQLTLISMIKQMIKENAQFIIATHSPILMAFPDAEIISLDTIPPSVANYDDLEHVKLTKLFLESPQQYLRHL